nr:ORF3 [Torque teno felis virus]
MINLINGLIGVHTRHLHPQDSQQTITGDLFYLRPLEDKLHNAHYFFFINYILRSSEMPFGDRCRVTFSLGDWFPTRNQPQPAAQLVPKPLVKKDLGHKANMISGPEISTPTASSKKRLLKELLDLVNELSDANWERDPLDLSLKSLDTSSSSEDCSESDWEDVTPQTPPLGGIAPAVPKKKSKMRYVPFCRRHAYDCEQNQ